MTATENSPPGRLLRAALDAAAAGMFVFPVQPRGKAPAVRDWESAATRDGDRLAAWFRARPYNLGLACGPSQVLVVDLDDGHGEPPPHAWPDARHGRDVLAQLARAAEQPVPIDTYTVATPGGGGEHLYFRAPEDVELRNTAGLLGWRIDTRGRGVVAAVGVSSRASVLIEALQTAMRRAKSAPACVWFRRGADAAGATDGGRRR